MRKRIQRGQQSPPRPQPLRSRWSRGSPGAQSRWDPPSGLQSSSPQPWRGQSRLHREGSPLVSAPSLVLAHQGSGCVPQPALDLALHPALLGSSFHVSPLSEQSSCCSQTGAAGAQGYYPEWQLVSGADSPKARLARVDRRPPSPPRVSSMIQPRAKKSFFIRKNPDTYRKKY